MTPGYIPPIYPSGANSVEARVKALEVAQHYDVQNQIAIRDELEHLRDMIGKVQADRDSDRSTLESTKAKILLYLLGAMGSALASLGIIVLKIKAPWVFQ